MASSSLPPRFDLEECRRLAGELDLPHFRARYPHLFLVTPDTRRAKARAVADDPEAEERIMYETAMVDVRALTRAMQTAIMIPVIKKAGNPFAERVSVGRAPNCDIVLRYSHVSKLHAHFLVTADGMTLVDQRSSNGTFVNGRQLAPSAPQAVRPGDAVRFGSLTLDLCDADEAYARSRMASF